jgi:hypothetical protein
LQVADTESFYDAARFNYPRFSAGPQVEAYGIPIKEAYHEVLFPEIADCRQADLFSFGGLGAGPRTPGNTIRKVYLCRAPAWIDQPGAILLFYKGKSTHGLSQALTTVGIFEDMAFAHSVEELRRLAGGRSVYSERQLLAWEASPHRPVKVINFLLAGHINPPILLSEMRSDGLISGHPPQSMFRVSRDRLTPPLRRICLGFEL